MPVRHLRTIAGVSSAAWDALAGTENPFIRHAYLDALERSGSVSQQAGWTPHHTILLDDDGNLIAAAPSYLKQHSWGEFVFDFTWADASHRAGVPYYPKCVSAVPFAPVTGPRLLANTPAAKTQLLHALLADVRSGQSSGWHGLFMSAPDLAAGAELPLIARTDLQFHWQNRAEPYSDFEDFLSTLKSDKRKKIRQERRRVAEAGIRFEMRVSGDFLDHEWDTIYQLYANTYLERGQVPYLTREFFRLYAQTSASPMRVIAGWDGPNLVAMALFLRTKTHLYGRHWGTNAQYANLHFETCYYQGLDYCIAQKISHYDAGAQGEHKLARGFLPVLTHSLHALGHPDLHRAVAKAMATERLVIQQRLKDAQSHSAYRTEA